MDYVKRLDKQIGKWWAIPRTMSYALLNGLTPKLGQRQRRRRALPSEVVGGRAGTERRHNSPLLTAVAAGIGLVTGLLANVGGFLARPPTCWSSASPCARRSAPASWSSPCCPSPRWPRIGRGVRILWT